MGVINKEGQGMALRKIKRFVIENDPAATAEMHSSHYLAEGNAADERGDHTKADAFFEKSQEWLDEANRLRGWQ